MILAVEIVGVSLLTALATSYALSGIILKSLFWFDGLLRRARK